MRIIVNPHNCIIDRSLINEKEINVTKCQFEFSNEIPSDFFKEAYFTLNGKTYKQELFNNECDIPPEVLEEKGTIEIGVVASKLANNKYEKRFNPSPCYQNTLIGSLKEEYENSEEITPSDKEQLINAINEAINQINTTIADLHDKVDSGYFNGKDALINGYNTLEILAGDNIIITQEENRLIISAIGVSPLPDNHLEDSEGNVFKTIDDAYFIVKESE